MKRLILPVACLLLALPVIHAQVRDVGKPAPPPTGKARISGIVKDQAGEPVRRANVKISGDMRLDRMTMTDEQGRFTLSDLPSGRFSVTASKAGYPQVSYGAKRPFRPGAGIFLQEGEHAADIALVLARGAVLTGTIYDEDGAPMPGVPVMAWEVRTSLSGERTLDYAGSEPITIISDDQGAYRVFGLPAGTYTVGTSWYYSGDRFEVRTPTEAEVRAAFTPTQSLRPVLTPPPTTPSPEPTRYNYAPVFSPGVLDPLAADTFTLKPGEERTGVNLQMQFQPTSRIEGTIVDSRGLPIAVQLTVTRRSAVQALNTSQVRPGQTDSRFTIPSLSPGLYSVSARSRDASSGAVMWASQDVSLSGGDPTMVTLSLLPAAAVAGRVVFEGTDLAQPPDLSRVTVRLVDVGPAAGNSTSATLDAAGLVTAAGVVPGRYMVRAAVPGAVPASGPAWTVRSVTTGGRDVTDVGFDITDGGLADLTVTFTSQVSELSGALTTQSGAPETDYFVIAIPANRDYWMPGSRRIVSTRPDAKGRYVFRGLPGGEYRIAVTTDLVARDLQEMNVIAQLAAQSIPATIAFGERRVVNIRTPEK
ncbi:MAG TPA: carboxypeptidase-like regulatory domain-containing protein [Vicinamibacterales bacterium]|nr:carboxypeptidase-like regulatory domain-containing protein [Vicinamibacterales bacterium]